MVTYDAAVRDNNTIRRQEPRLAVWIIDDNKSFSVAFSRYIEDITRIPCTKCFDSADSALMALRGRTDEPDVILLDVEMPGINGLDAISPLKQAAPRSRIYMVTATDSPWHRQTASERGADGYFLKLDVRKEVLLEILDCPKL